MTAKNLWGQLPRGDEGGKTPHAILNEQAEALREGTDNFLLAVVRTKSEGRDLVHELNVIAPYLNNYEVGIVRAEHGALTYPVRIYDLVGDKFYSEVCPDEQEFEKKLESVLTSTNAKKIIGSLLSQSSPRAPGPAPKRVEK